ncbi:MAG: methylmalonyl-CoA mutase family protein, partial [Deltaproteobacteria bacterium]|nr:methylmalonyl-CoA mutase family protein [Deltaproteobacteria bacterium]
MYSEEERKKIEKEYAEWKEKVFKKNFEKLPPRLERFSTVSDMEMPELSTPADIQGFDYLRDLGFPGCYPFTRGVQPTMYRGRLWTMRQFAGFGTCFDTNKRYKFLLENGQTGLSAVSYTHLRAHET